MGKRQRRRLREQGGQRGQGDQQQGGSPAVIVNAGLATAEGAVMPGPDNDDDED
jgi:hypothetical protein